MHLKDHPNIFNQCLLSIVKRLSHLLIDMGSYFLNWVNTFYIVLLPAGSPSNSLTEFKIGGIVSKHVFSIALVLI